MTDSPAPLCLGWPIPEQRPFAALYNTEIRRVPHLYDPPDIYGTVGRTERIGREYPEIHVWADQIAQEWHGKPFTMLRDPGRRARIVAGMMYTAHHEGTPRIKAIEPYLLALREDARERALTWVTRVALAVASFLGIYSTSRGQKAWGTAAGREIAGMAAEAAALVSQFAELAHASDPLDVEKAAAASALLLDAMELVTARTPGTVDDQALDAIRAALGEALRVAHELMDDFDDAGPEDAQASEEDIDEDLDEAGA